MITRILRCGRIVTTIMDDQEHIVPCELVAVAKKYVWGLANRLRHDGFQVRKQRTPDKMKGYHIYSVSPKFRH